MNSTLHYSLCIVFLIHLCSCKKELEPQENTPASKLVELGLIQDTTKTNTPSLMASNTTTSNTIMQPTDAVNPAHGMPGHDCAVPVGAPLNKKQNNSNNLETTKPVITQSQQNNVVTTSINVPKAAPGMNPSHGQPGHRCDIPVGAPLNSAPPKSSTTTSENITTDNTFSVTPSTVEHPVPVLLSTESTNE